MEKKISEQKAKIENLLKQIVDVKKDKITETQKLSIELSKLKVNNNLLSKELEATKKQLEEKEKEIEKHINNNNDTKNSIDGNLNDDLNELKEKNKGLEEENILLRQELENEKAKNKEQNEDNGNEIKGGKYNLFVSYVTQLLNEMKPNEGKEKYLYNKLKGIIEKTEKEKEANDKNKK